MDRKVILAIESSCDETSAAIVINGREVLSNVISSQIEIHEKFGGVVPEVASRKHIEVINAVVEEALEKADMKVNHIEGHICANFIEHKDLKPPFVSLVVSGGHTFIVYVKDYGEYEIIGETRDDAAGEAYDKVARAIGLGYPGGPKIDKLSKEGDPNSISFPRARFHDDTLDFSFSGLKSAVLNYLNKKSMLNEEVNTADVAASFQKAVVEVLTDNAMVTCEKRGIDRIAIAGGVASNSGLRENLINKGNEKGIKILFPSLELCTDNAAMIGSAAYYQWELGNVSTMDLNAKPNLKLGEK